MTEQEESKLISRKNKGEKKTRSVTKVELKINGDEVEEFN